MVSKLCKLQNENKFEDSHKGYFNVRGPMNLSLSEGCKRNKSLRYSALNLSAKSAIRVGSLIPCLL